MTSSTTDEDIQNTSIIATSVHTAKPEPPKLPTFFQIVGRIIKKTLLRWGRPDGGDVHGRAPYRLGRLPAGLELTAAQLGTISMRM